MKEIIQDIIRYKYIILLLLISFVSHIEWFDFNNTLFFADWRHWNDFSTKTLFSINATWTDIETIGAPNIQIPFYFFQSIWVLVTTLGGSFDIAVKITLLIPIIILGSVTPYFLIQYIFKNDNIAFISALFYSTTTYFLIKETAHIPIAFIYAITPLLFLYLGKSINTPSKKNWIILFCIYNISIFYEIRIMYIVTLMMILYFIIFLEWKNIQIYIRNIVLFLIGSIFINLFWIFPIIFSHTNETISEVANRGLFGNHLFDIWHAITLYESSWTGGIPNQKFIMQNIPWYFYIIPIFALSAFILYKKKYIKYYIFFGVMSLLGIFLTKQSGEPFSGSYLWIYENIPGFNLFREASKFYAVTAFGYMGLIALFLSSLYKKKYLFITASSLLILLAFINLKPLITQEIGTLFVERTIPQEYKKIEKEKTYSNRIERNIWIPFYSQWSYFSYKNTKTSIIHILYILQKNDIISHLDEKDLSNDIKKLFHKNYFSFFLDLMNVSEIYIPLQDIENNDDFFQYYGGESNKNIRKWYINMMNSINYLQKDTNYNREIKIYKNPSVKSYIHTFTGLISFSSLSELEKKFLFVQNELEKDFYFIFTQRKQLNYPVISTENIFHENIRISNRKDNTTIEKTVNFFQKEENIKILKKQIFQNILLEKNGKIYLYRIKKEKFTFNNKILFSKNEENSKELPLQKNTEYIIENNNKFFTININDDFSYILLDDASKAIKIYKTSKNKIKNGGFEKSLWSNKVGDCNNYDNNGILKMKQSKQSSSGNYSLELSSERHIACTSQLISLSPGEYIFSLDYQGKNSKLASFYIEYNTRNSLNNSKKIPINNHKWNHYIQKLSVPIGTTKAELFLYGYSQEQAGNKNITRYDNVVLKKLLLLQEIAPVQDKNLFIQAPLKKKEKNVFHFIEKKQTFFNRIPNFSFEKHLWSKDIGDCNNYDNNPQISMKRNDTDFSHGKYSLELSSIRHNACTSAGYLAIEEGNKYLLEFDYKAINTKFAGISIAFDDEKSSSFYKQISIQNDKWNTFSQVITTPLGASTAAPTIYAYESDGMTKNTVLYDNFHFIELPQEEYYLVSEPEEKLENPKQITFDIEDSTHKYIHVKGATTPFYIAMSEKYSPDWELQFNNQKRKTFWGTWHPLSEIDSIDNSQHFALETFLNGWYFDIHTYCKQKNMCIKNKDGSYDIELVAEFKPQRWLYLGGIISVATLFLVIFFLIYLLITDKKKIKKHWNKPTTPPPVDRYE